MPQSPRTVMAVVCFPLSSRSSLALLTSTRALPQIAFFQLITLTWHPQCSHLPAPLTTADSSCSSLLPMTSGTTLTYLPLPWGAQLLLLSATPSFCKTNASASVVPPPAPCTLRCLYQLPSDSSSVLSFAMHPAERLPGTVTPTCEELTWEGCSSAQHPHSPTAAGPVLWGIRDMGI